ncbi:MAG: ParB N-terminal domain-containing protein [Defluviitaleaceae bacterium]|nr:ParB N-terminal domain-containing protein [Defluviitaleaceae bacterium]
MSFNLKNPTANLSLLKSTHQSSELSIENVKIEKLAHFKNHPFKLYTGKRFLDMVESIKNNGILNPLIVRPIPPGREEKEFKYEILAGHNRIEAAKEASLKIVPCIIKDFTDDEAKLILIESNLMQRSFSELSLSEKIYIVSIYYNALKSQGKRTDLVKDVNSFLEDKKLAAEETGEKYELNKNTIARYLRLNKLSNELKILLDDGSLKMRAGLALSFLKEAEQAEIYKYLLENKIKISIDQAEALKKISQTGIWQYRHTIDTLFNSAEKSINFLKIKYDKIKTYFEPSQTEKEIEAELIEALKFYREHK